MVGTRESESAANSSFYYSFLLLPRARREAITAVYGFMRVVDDAVDEPGELPLDYWAGELERIYTGTPEHSIGQRLQVVVRRFDLRREHFEELLAGCAMDLEERRYESFAELVQYCRCVASAVGRACLPIFGASEELSGEYADRLGLALQVTNILRDVGEDAARGRIYLPLEDLRAHSVSEGDLLARRDSSEFRALMRFEGQRASELFQAALAALPRARSERRALLAPRVMGAIYAALLDEMRRCGYPALERRVTLSRWRKARLAARTWLETRLGAPRRTSGRGSLTGD